MDFFRRLPDAGLREELIFRLLPATNSIKSRPRAAFFSFRIPASLIGLASTLPVARKLLVAHVVLACRDEQKISIRYGPQHFKTIAITSAKLFLNDRSQAVRLPKAFRFDGLTEVFIERDGDRVMLSPVRRPSIERLIGVLDQLDAFPDRLQPGVSDQRESL